MKTLFVPAKADGRIEIERKAAEKIPDRIGLVAAVQFSHLLPEIKKQLMSYGKTVLIGKGKQTIPGQILGCDSSAAEAIKDKVDAFLYVGTGDFHPVPVALKTGKKVFVYNPDSEELSALGDDEVTRLKNAKKAGILKFLNSDEIGIIVSIKPGQMRLEEAKRLKKLIEGKGKNAYMFITDNINLSELENFNFIQCWVNTACPRIEGKGIVDGEDILDLMR